MTNPYRNINELREWLKANSSGVYRPSAHAARVIEEQEYEITTLRDENDRIRAKLAAMESQEPVLIVGSEDFNEDLLSLKKGTRLYESPVPPDKPDRITEQDALPDAYREEWKRHVMIMWTCARKHDSSIPSDVLDYMRDQLLNKLNADREQVPAVAVTDGFREIVEAVAHIGVDFGYGNFVLSQEHIEKARALLEAAPSRSQQSDEGDCAVAAIEYAIDTDEGLDFLRYWFYGEFDVLRRNWDNIPDRVFIGADPLFNSERCPSQQNAVADAERFCDSHCTWRDHHPDCPSHESEQSASPAPDSEGE